MSKSAYEAKDYGENYKAATTMTSRDKAKDPFNAAYQERH